MRFVVELSRTPDGRVEGAVTPEGCSPVTFSGWLELLRILEPPEPAVERPEDDDPPENRHNLTGAGEDAAPPPLLAPGGEQ